MQIVEAQKEIQSTLSSKAIEFLRNRKKASSKAMPAETLHQEVTSLLPSQEDQKSNVIQQKEQNKATETLQQSVRGRLTRGKKLHTLLI